MSIDWNGMLKYSKTDFTDAEDHFFDAVRYGLSGVTISTHTAGMQPKTNIIPSQRWMTQVVACNPCHIFWKKGVSSFDAIAPPAKAFPYNSFMYDEDGWHRCAAVPPAPKAKIWKPIPESEVPVELRTKLLLLS